MATATRISNAAAIAACDAIVDRVDLGTTNATGKVRIYDGTQPADPDTAVSSQNLLAEVDLRAPGSGGAFGGAVDAAPGGQATAGGLPISDTSINATGTASWFRVVDRDETAIFDGSVDVSANSPDMTVNTTSFQSGATFEITAWTVTMPES